MEANKKKENKKKWIKQKYSNKEKVNQWKEKRRKIALNHYRAQFKDVNLPEPKNNSVSRKNHRYGKSKYKSALEEYNRMKNEKKIKKETKSKITAEIQESLENYNKRKKIKNKKLLKKTQKGQPLMKERLQLLLEKIQSQIIR